MFFFLIHLRCHNRNGSTCVYALVLLNMSLFLVDSMNYEGSLISREGSDDESKENEDMEGSLQTLGIAPYQFEPVAPMNESLPSNHSI